jgi:hypothetical protein
MKDQDVADIMARAVQMARALLERQARGSDVAILAAAAMPMMQGRKRRRPAIDPVVAESERDEEAAKGNPLAAAAAAFGDHAFTLAELANSSGVAIDTRRDEMEVGVMLRRWGYSRARVMIDGSRNYRWSRL